MGLPRLLVLVAALFSLLLLLPRGGGVGTEDDNFPRLWALVEGAQTGGEGDRGPRERVEAAALRLGGAAGFWGTKAPDGWRCTILPSELSAGTETCTLLYGEPVGWETNRE